ncbi:MAG TPA: anaerobic ribonucleoside-triphosphate reductase activating protein [Candidatus Avacidaminococcus intestinavium]|uniref:Anaerobic ribonucleoside-triphosphate reductase-activating protein n=1 Tax=Candidatus Avacidaminococcus intestinavium TaxID=2840684 RepID=A0A9D1MNW6_9FIRM|nr:anaerobic ribonucleoside-triphosphate reductase activating protein [Candidatus Avacidaminococcus intestinavium]
MTKLIQVADILAESVVDGKGLRVVVFFQGCPRRCPGCHNEALLPFKGGKQYTPAALADQILKKVTPLHKGITFSGGDPLAQADGLLEVIQILKQKQSTLDYWVYTGYLYEDVSEYDVLHEIDVLVDGPFILAERDLTLPFRGSTNQRILDVPKSLAMNKATILVFS